MKRKCWFMGRHAWVKIPPMARLLNIVGLVAFNRLFPLIPVIEDRTSHVRVRTYRGSLFLG
ncbi:hypothetical protein OOU_Y34scaffold00399g5 [Pyricularia oryzae Y34]|uniref:Uncharacterized protein n=2 Tax=Pyricularia oryzae TaxID=318829 RepID=A0AA97P2B7_PYRO3|nr:hypothetical protein OOU_Y34scaffold00399g5 [Pyricularia oryzae Y34]